MIYYHKVPASTIDFLLEFYNLQMFLAALSDCAIVADDKFHMPTNTYLKNNLLGALSQLIETNLRFQTHLHLQLPSSDPFQNIPPHSFSKLLPARLNENYISIKMEVEHYLSNMFYNLITVVLHDWRTYGEMRRFLMRLDKLECK